MGVKMKRWEYQLATADALYDEGMKGWRLVPIPGVVARGKVVNGEGQSAALPVFIMEREYDEEVAAAELAAAKE